MYHMAYLSRMLDSPMREHDEPQGMDGVVEIQGQRNPELGEHEVRSHLYSSRR